MTLPDSLPSYPSEAARADGSPFQHPLVVFKSDDDLRLRNGDVTARIELDTLTLLRHSSPFARLTFPIPAQQAFDDVFRSGAPAELLIVRYSTSEQPVEHTTARVVP